VLSAFISSPTLWIPQVIKDMVEPETSRFGGVSILLFLRSDRDSAKFCGAEPCVKFDEYGVI